MSDDSSASVGPTRPSEILPIFPLTGTILLPAGLLPLHIFEPRYCNMIEALVAAGDGARIGMVQPLVPDPDDQHGPADGEEPAAVTDVPSVYAVGCAGEIEQVEALPHRRFVVLLRGQERFRIRTEIEPLDGYRRIEADYQEFSVDLADHDAEVATEPLLDALRGFGLSRGFQLDTSQLERLSGLALLNGLAMNLPFSPAEKQALLEAPDLDARRSMLMTLLSMGFDALTPDPFAELANLAN